MTENGTSSGVVVPADTRLRLVHGYLQVVADEAGIDLLHVKGAAVNPSIQAGLRGSLDVDVIVRPAHVERFVRVLHEREWVTVTGFEEGSAFSHAMNMRHDLGLVDVHRSWPGFQIPAVDAFDALWAERDEAVIAGISCPVPSLAMQRLILLLHYGRSGGQRPDDLDASWRMLDVDSQAEIRALADRFDARLAMAVATGEDAEYVSDPAYPLWHYFSRGQGGRLEEWHGRWSAARGVQAKLKVLRRLVTVNSALLQEELGRPPRREDYVRAYQKRARVAFDDARREIARRGRGAR